MSEELPTAAEIEGHRPDPYEAVLNSHGHQVCKPGDELVLRKDVPPAWKCPECGTVFYCENPKFCPECEWETPAAVRKDGLEPIGSEKQWFVPQDNEKESDEVGCE